MYQEAERLRSFTRRAIFAGAAQSVLFAGLGARLYHLQIQKSEDYALLAEDNRVNQRLLIPPRGRIYDIAGRPLARNVPTYRIRVIRERTLDLRKTLERLSTLVELRPEELEDVIIRAEARRAFVPIDVREGLTWEEVSRIAIRAPELPGIVVDSSLLRDYPHAEILAHVLGYVGPVNERELEED
ncbi:MAG: penicillin-binding protein 2, partial [Geminicoccaceae bacterium]|nr:penicillin-binding protein 2 [Geminicoccaceae bacterium]